MYTLNEATGTVTRVSDGAVCAPAQSVDDPLFVEYAAWIAEGWTPTVVRTTPFDVAQFEAGMNKAIYDLLNGTAAALGYGTEQTEPFVSAMTYVTSAHATRGPQAVALRDWRDAVWDYCTTVKAACLAGTRAIPTPDQLLAELPDLSV